MCLADPSTLVKVQDYIRETKRHMEQERNQRVVLENKLRVIVREKQELQRYQPHAIQAQAPWAYPFYENIDLYNIIISYTQSHTGFFLKKKKKVPHCG